MLRKHKEWAERAKPGECRIIINELHECLYCFKDKFGEMYKEYIFIDLSPERIKRLALTARRLGWIRARNLGPEFVYLDRFYICYGNNDGNKYKTISTEEYRTPAIESYKDGNI